MTPQSCLLIESRRFPILEGEKRELVNEGMFLQALCTHLQERLPSAGFQVPFFCNEDWGSWLQTERAASAWACASIPIQAPIPIRIATP